ncbi:DUF937 domain-containing protein [Terrabacter terrigena]|uniref:DUF937 domain-containing protein n=1 Tax=Terrabacter terrigena TaxID=574718 RepID=A0ABW3MSP7_9MICO
MGAYDEILDQVPVDQLAGQLGVGSDEVRLAAQNALPALLAGLHANASDPAAADSLMAALSDHQAPVKGLDNVDEQDGRAIVGNIFGDNTDQVVSQLGGLGGLGGSAARGGASGGIVQKLLPILAPIVLSWLAGKVGQGGGLGGVPGGSEPAPSTGGGATDGGALFPGGAGADSGPVQAPGTATPTGGAATGGSNPLQDILGQVLGGAAGGGAGSGGSGGAGDILGGLLGGLLGAGKR